MHTTPRDERHDIEHERRATERATFLAEASRLLADTLDYEATLATVAGLALPHLGAWCFVDVVGPGRGMRRLAVIHPDPANQELARRLEAGWPPERDDPFGLPRAMYTRRSEVIQDVTDEMLQAAAHGEDNLRILRRLGIGSLMVVPLIAHGEVLGAITYIAPRSHHHYTDDELELAEDLAARCAVAIDNARLFREAKHAQALAEDANRAKTLFLSTMSHELRTPLNAIAGYTELMEIGVHGPLTDEQRQDLRRIRANQRHLLGLVNSVLDYARMEAGRLVFRLANVRLRDVLREVETIVLPLAAERAVEFQHECVDHGIVVRADQEKLQQILTNLVVNGIKFSRDGGRVSVECVTEDGNALVRVVDDGIGIAEEHLESIFRPFVQVVEGTTRKEEGTGLGLAISRSLARAMGGDLWVESEVGEGSTFTVCVPLAGAEHALDEVPIRVGQADLEDPIFMGRADVEDDSLGGAVA
ncbi:MAG TPA: HAMP domain-containing sensor histidine kinase [Longimicrobiales bacterium]|nr:HAMP domain-containing sensor histidine kinase [Longimicrobiales bacterium]